MAQTPLVKRSTMYSYFQTESEGDGKNFDKGSLKI